jgi:hypothetical protein
VTATELTTPLPTTAPGCEEVGSGDCICSPCPDFHSNPSSKPIQDAQCYFTVTVTGLVVADTSQCSDRLMQTIANATVAFLDSVPEQTLPGSEEIPPITLPGTKPGTPVARADCLPFSVSASC